MHDYGYTFANARRRSNSSNQGLEGFKTKFESIDHDPVFEEDAPGADEADKVKAGDSKGNGSGTRELDSDPKKE